MEIQFYKLSEPYGCFSNFSRDPFFLEGKGWPTTEHYFQSQKFRGTPHEDEVRLAKTPAAAAKLGRDRSRPLRGDWESVKEQVMFEACLAKFRQNLEIREILLGTGDALLVEHTSKDSYWGDGGDGSGKNRLGHILMKVRETLTGPTLRTFSIEEVADIVECEGLGYAVEFYMDEESIEDPELRSSWAQARSALGRIRELLPELDDQL